MTVELLGYIVVTQTATRQSSSVYVVALVDQKFYLC